LKRLLLIRHAKSSWDYPELSDHERPLNKRGRKDAPMMAQRLADISENLEAIISSTAVRALGIAEPIAGLMETDIIKSSQLYTFSSSDLFESILMLPDQYQKVGMVGHNPAITILTNHLLDNIIDNVPTSGIVALNCNIESWSDFSADCCELDYFDYPKRI
jgi:phosphohistidine phosphatase